MLSIQMDIENIIRPNFNYLTKYIIPRTLKKMSFC